MALKWNTQVTVRLTDRKFAALTMSPTGDIHQFTRKLGNEINSLSRVHAPKRTGEIRRKIYSRNPRCNATSVNVRIECSAPHAYWVHEGTPAHAGDMVMYAGVRYGSRPRSSAIVSGPTMGGFGPFTTFIGKKVAYRAGQTGNPFMHRAAELVEARYGL